MERATSYAEFGDAADGGSPAFAIPQNVFAETVTEVKHYTDRLFKFRITRPKEFRFRSGEFIMIGLPNSAQAGVPRLFHCESLLGRRDRVLLDQGARRAADGTSAEDRARRHGADAQEADGHAGAGRLVPGKRLYMLSTGTGVAPFASLIRDPETYEKFEEVVLVQTCRRIAELGYITGMVEGLERGSADRRTRRRSSETAYDDDSRGVAAHGPHHRLDAERPVLRRDGLAADRPGGGSRHDLRLDGDDQGHQGDARESSVSRKAPTARRPPMSWSGPSSAEAGTRRRAGEAASARPRVSGTSFVPARPRIGRIRRREPLQRRMLRSVETAMSVEVAA